MALLVVWAPQQYEDLKTAAVFVGRYDRESEFDQRWQSFDTVCSVQFQCNSPLVPSNAKMLEG